MLRKYKTPAQWLAEVPSARLYILMSPTGIIKNWHTGTEAPEGKWCLIGIID